MKNEIFRKFTKLEKPLGEKARESKEIRGEVIKTAQETLLDYIPKEGELKSIEFGCGFNPLLRPENLKKAGLTANEITLLDERELPGIDGLKGTNFFRHDLKKEILDGHRSKYNLVVSKDLINAQEIKLEDIDSIAKRTDEVLVNGGTAIHSTVVPILEKIPGLKGATEREIKGRLQRLREWFIKMGYKTEITRQPVLSEVREVSLHLCTLIVNKSTKIGKEVVEK